MCRIKDNALRITLVYSVAALFWVVLSDAIIADLPEEVAVARLHTYKQVLYLLAGALLAHCLLRAALYRRSRQ